MNLLSDVAGPLILFADAFAFLVLAASGLAVIFGMMGIVNLAHGEFIMGGAYLTVAAAHAGAPLPVAIAAGAVGAGLIGLAVETLLVRHLYGRPLDSIVLTWGLSLIATQSTLIGLGSSMPGIGTPLGSFTVGAYSYSAYRLVLFAAAVAVLVGLYALFNGTRFGIAARATIQNPAMAAALGLDTRRIYRLTFAVGAGLAGLAGGLYAPTMTLVPTMGSSFMTAAFVTVVVGGADVFLGTAPAAALLGGITAMTDHLKGPLYAQIALLLAVIVTIRVLPRGLSHLFGDD